MTDDWPLSFFHVKEGSTIYVENIETEVASILKKQLSSRSKYFKQLNLLPTLGTIVESKNEDKESQLKNRCQGSKIGRGERGESFSSNEIMEIIVQAVKNNDVQQVKELIHDEGDKIPINVLWNGGWNILHNACYYGFEEIAFELLKAGADVNMKSDNNEWAPLHLAAYKGHANGKLNLFNLYFIYLIYYLILVVRCLLTYKHFNKNTSEIDVNLNLGPNGTALHCACKKNHLQIVSLLLLHKANFR